MSERLGNSNLDIPLGDEEKWDFSDQEFAGDRLEPINIQRKEPEATERRSRRTAYVDKSPTDKAREDTKIGTALGALGGAAVGLGFAGAGFSAPIAMAAVGGAIAHNKLKKEEIRREQERWNEEYGDINWLKEFKKQVEEIEGKK